MPPQSFHEIIELIREDDDRFEPGAYYFLREALDFSVRKFRSNQSGQQRHITGAELCEGIREYALEQYGPMARTLLESWGIHSTNDFGIIVFNLIEYGVFGKTEEDRFEDFANVFSFDEAFTEPFRPSSSTQVFDFSSHQPSKD